MRIVTAALLVALATIAVRTAQAAEAMPGSIPPDITVAADGSGDFKTVQQALQSIPRDNTQRMIVYVKDGLYKERLNVAAAFVTLRGQSRKGTRIEFSPGAGGAGGSVVTLGGTDFMLDNITLLNSGGDPEPHAVTLSTSTSDRVVLIDSDILSEGADTVSLWNNVGRYYHARCNFRGAVDSVCPHGWCYITDSAFYETRHTATIWHDGKGDANKKFVLRNCKFDGLGDFDLGRHHHDGEFIFIDCAFAGGMSDHAIYRVIYPLEGGVPTADDIRNNLQHDATNIWGERNYFYNTHRAGGDFAWMKNNLASFSQTLRPQEITAAWAFAGSGSAWDPETKARPAIQSIQAHDQRIAVTFSEPITVKGKPALVLGDGSSAPYTSGSGSPVLLFAAPTTASAKAFTLNGGHLISTIATATIRDADLTLPATSIEK